MGLSRPGRARLDGRGVSDPSVGDVRSGRGNVVIPRIRFITIAVAALALHASVGASAADYERMEVVDIKLDAPKLAGKKVEVAGRLIVFIGEVNIESSDNHVSVYVDTDHLTREERREMMINCEDRRCPAVLQGAIGLVTRRSGTKEWGVVADSLATKGR